VTGACVLVGSGISLYFAGRAGTMTAAFQANEADKYSLKTIIMQKKIWFSAKKVAGVVVFG